MLSRLFGIQHMKHDDRRHGKHSGRPKGAAAPTRFQAVDHQHSDDLAGGSTLPRYPDDRRNLFSFRENKNRISLVKYRSRHGKMIASDLPTLTGTPARLLPFRPPESFYRIFFCKKAG